MDTDWELEIWLKQIDHRKESQKTEGKEREFSAYTQGSYTGRGYHLLGHPGLLTRFTV